MAPNAQTTPRRVRPETLGGACWNGAEKVNAELFALTHGAFVRQILRDREDDVEATNGALERIGRSIGARIIEEYLAKTNASAGGVSVVRGCDGDDGQGWIEDVFKRRGEDEGLERGEG